jgi:hypothetical protein
MCGFKTHVIDGFPATVAVIFSDGTEATVVSSNLCGLTDDQLQDDRTKLLILAARIVEPSFQPDKL